MPLPSPHMIHLCIEAGKDRIMACGMRQLADGQRFVHDTAAACIRVNCPVCAPECQQLGTPISQLSGRPGEPGFERFAAIGRSWGYD